jgi:hypothetical protein
MLRLHALAQFLAPGNASRSTKRIRRLNQFPAALVVYAPNQLSHSLSLSLSLSDPGGGSVMRRRERE